VKTFLFIISFFNCLLLNAQNRNSIWCFGDSAGIDFSNLNNPVSFSSAMNGRGSSTSISDSLGNLLFNTYTHAGQLGDRTIVINKNFQVMQGGDSLVGEGWYQENVTIPAPGNSNLFYVFSIGITGSSQLGLYYSIIDLSLNGGLGEVTVKNTQLSNVQAFDGIAAIKHGNGRDWWLIFKPVLPNNNIFYIYLISPSGISNPFLTPMGEIINNTAGCISFNKSGDKMLLTSWDNIIEICDFDRCSGMFSNVKVIEPENVAGQPGIHFSSCFSPSSNIIYVTHIPYFPSDTIYFLYQYDLLANDIANSRDTIFYTYSPVMLSGMKLAPDDKIYVSTYYDCGNCFPYPDSVYNMFNMNLGVISQPDSLGQGCSFQPNSFSLGGKRAYFGLPNNPDYELGPVIGSPCDSLFLSVTSLSGIEEINVYPNPFFNKVTLHPARNSNAEILIEVFNSSGEKLFQKTAHLELQDLDLSHLPKGIYILRMSANRFVATSKLVKL
jgi:hypothetical protein